MSTVRIISRDNGVGLTRDMALVAELFRDAGHEVEVVAYGGNRLASHLLELRQWARHALGKRVDVQIFLERVYRRLLPLGARNVLVPNPEWFSPRWSALLPRFDVVACKTRHGQRIFESLASNVIEVGFTSDDILDPTVERQRQFFHLAGRSSAKGTEAVLDAWARHPEWPRLIVVQNPKTATRSVTAANVEHRVEYVDARALQQLQNACRFHLCPSEIEGFGHYLNEARSVGAVVLTSDGAPMHELIDASHGVLLAPACRRPDGLVERCLVDVAGIEAGVATVLAFDEAEIARRSRIARSHFEVDDRRFREGFVRDIMQAAGLV